MIPCTFRLPDWHTTFWQWTQVFGLSSRNCICWCAFASGNVHPSWQVPLIGTDPASYPYTLLNGEHSNLIQLGCSPPVGDSPAVQPQLPTHSQCYLFTGQNMEKWPWSYPRTP
jgi:hypothetical protein